MALRDAEVHPPNTAATQFFSIKVLAFSANTAGSDLPSCCTTSNFLPSTPPLALISSTAICSESDTVFSERAMVPLSEFTKPMAMLFALVSTQLCAGVPEPSDSMAFLSATVRPQPQPLVKATTAASTIAAATGRIIPNFAIRLFLSRTTPKQLHAHLSQPLSRVVLPLCFQNVSRMTSSLTRRRKPCVHKGIHGDGFRPDADGRGSALRDGRHRHRPERALQHERKKSDDKKQAGRRTDMRSVRRPAPYRGTRRAVSPNLDRSGR